MSDPEGYRFLPHDQERCQCEGCQQHREGAAPRCGMRKPGGTATCIEPAGHAGPDGRGRSHGDGTVIRWIYR